MARPADNIWYELSHHQQAAVREAEDQSFGDTEEDDFSFGSGDDEDDGHVDEEEEEDDNSWGWGK